MKRFALSALMVLAPLGLAFNGCSNPPPIGPPHFTATPNYPTPTITDTPYANSQTTITPTPFVHVTTTPSPYAYPTASGFTPTMTPTPYSPTTWTYYSSFGQTGTDGINGDFEGAEGIAIGNGFIAVSDYNYGNVQVFNNNGVYLYSFTPPGNPSNLEGMAMDNNGELYVCNTSNGEVDGYYLGTAGATYDYTWTGQGVLAAPFGVKIDPSGNLVVCDASNGAAYNIAWADDTNLGPTIGNPTGFSPNDLALDNVGNIYMGDYNPYGGPYTGRIVEYGPNYNYSNTITGSTWTLDLGNPIYSLIFDSQQNLFVSDPEDGPVVYMTTQGGYLGEIDGFSWAESLAVDGSGDLFVVDYNNNQIDEFTR